ncbi:MAG TPA: efflux RND transporter permease subunit [Vulgatibacter sp.]|nr:efflux RND transporter permease subunit [Vulgatibacter sp.]
MNVSRLFIVRPVMTTLVMLAILIFGVAAYRLLPVSDLPNVDFPTLVVTAALPGANPDTMAASVATPLEQQFTAIQGLDQMTSSSTLGNTQITLQFALDRSIDAAAQDVQAAINAAQRLLPPTLPSPPTYRKVNPADQPILYLALTSPTLPLAEIDEYAETLMAQRISMVSGVAQVQVFGSQKYAVRVRVDPNELATRGVGIDEVSRAVQAANVNLPSGVLWGADTAFTLESEGQLFRAEAYRPLIVAWRDGSPVRLEALGKVVDSVENDKTAAWFNRDRSVVLAVQRQPGTNTVAVSDAVRRLLPTFREEIPASVSIHLLYDRADSIRASVNDVKTTLVVALILVVLVIFLFLRNLSATIIPSLALPFSIVGTFAVMYLLGYSLDNLSLMALTLSIGFVIDDAIVMLENIVRHLEMGRRPLEAALVGSKEITFTIVSMTLSLAAVFIPLLFMGGVVGRLFREFAVTIGVAILISGVVSLSLTPMLSSRFLRVRKRPPNRLYAWSERIFDGALRVYDRALAWNLRHRLGVLLVSAIVLVLTLLLFAWIPKGFLPTEDAGQIFVFTEGREGISFEAMSAHQQALADVISEEPGVESLMSTVGAVTGQAPNSGIIFVRLVPRSERSRSADEIVTALRPKLMGVVGIDSFPQVPPPVPLTGVLTRSQYQYTLQGTDKDQLYAAAQAAEERIRALPQLRDVTSDLRLKNPQITLTVDRDKASALGLTMAQIENTLYDAYGSRQISYIYTSTNTYQVIIEVEPRFQLDPASLSLLYVQAGSGALVPLDAVARMERTVGPLSVNHAGQLPAVTISFNLPPGVALGDVVGTIQEAVAPVLPPTISTRFQGTAEAFQSSFRGLGYLLIAAILVIYIVLGILYESFVHPVTILTALPFAGFGALLTLLAFGEELNVYAFVGVIMLIGLVKKNGIMMIDFALEAEKEELSTREAIHRACLIRFRPIMMTTVAALVGALPIALAWGAGAESRRPLGLAVVGGLLFSQTLTLFVTPVFFVYGDRFQRWAGRVLSRYHEGEARP